MKIAEIHERINGITEIPANEQCIGHFQMAVRALLQDLTEELAKLQKLLGVYNG